MQFLSQPSSQSHLYQLIIVNKIDASPTHITGASALRNIRCGRLILAFSFLADFTNILQRD
jgi:hypothetical protein